MNRKRKKELEAKIKRQMAFVDIPTAVFSGTALGLYLDGVVIGLGVFSFSSDRWEVLMPAFGLVMAGLIVTAIGFGYWWLVPRKSGVLWPSLSGFAPLIAFLSFLSACVVGINIYFHYFK